MCWNKIFTSSMCRFVATEQSFATVSFVMSLYPSVRSVSVEKLGSHWTDFHETWYFSIFPEICRENSSFINL